MYTLNELGELLMELLAANSPAQRIIDDKLHNYKAVAKICLEVSLTDIHSDMHDVSFGTCLVLKSRQLKLLGTCTAC